MLDLPITLDLASETGRRFAVLPPDFAQKNEIAHWVIYYEYLR